MSYATIDDVADRMGRDLDPSEAEIVSARLDDVEAVIRTRVPDIAERVATSPTLGRLLAMVEADAVIRVIRNPRGLTAETDGDYGYRITPDAAKGRISIEPDEWKLLGVKGDVIALNLRIGAVMPSRQEGEYVRHRGKSGPETKPFEQGLDEAVWS